MILLGLAMISLFSKPLMTQLAVMATSVTDDPLTFILNFGVLGVWVFSSVTGIQPTRGEVRRLEGEVDRLIEDGKRRDERDRAKDQAVEALVGLMTSRTLPTLATAVAEMPQAAQSDAALGKRMEAWLARAERVFGDEGST